MSRNDSILNRLNVSALPQHLTDLSKDTQAFHQARRELDTEASVSEPRCPFAFWRHAREYYDGKLSNVIVMLQMRRCQLLSEGELQLKERLGWDPSCLRQLMDQEYLGI